MILNQEGLAIRYRKALEALYETRGEMQLIIEPLKEATGWPNWPSWAGKGAPRRQQSVGQRH